MYDEIKTWYNGYMCGDVPIYNPGSIVNLCEKKRIGLFWTETGGTSTIQNLLWKTDVEFKGNASKLLQGQSIVAQLQEDIRYDDLQHSNSVDLWTLLYYAGYLTMDSQNQLVIPNDEVRSQWNGWFRHCLDRKSTSVRSLLEFLLAADVTGFSEIFPQVVLATLSYFDVGRDSAEKFYHAFSLGLFVACRDQGFEVSSNRESRTGRFDMITPRLHQTIGIIIEFKIVRAGETLKLAAENGLKQIDDKNYRAGMACHVERVVEIGIAFSR